MKDQNNFNDERQDDEDELMEMRAEIDSFCYEARVASMNFAMHVGKDKFLSTKE